MEYLSIKDISEKWGISKRRIQVLCREGRVTGAKMIGNMWVVPENAKKPVDARSDAPVKKKADIQDISTRNKCKKLLKSMNGKCEKILEAKENHRLYILSIISAALCKHYTGTDFRKIFRTVCEDIGLREVPFPDKWLIGEVEEFIAEVESDRDLDNILSWGYQYSNKILSDTDKHIYDRTQFFTEKYMIDYLITEIPEIMTAGKILDPCVGGGNFLAECLEMLMDPIEDEVDISAIVRQSDKLYGYDIDPQIARIALVNIRLRAMSVLAAKNIPNAFDYWERVMPHIFCPEDDDWIEGSLRLSGKRVFDICRHKDVDISLTLNNADVIVTNPPFATMKGMAQEQKDFLKQMYPLANCDMCVAFLDAIYNMLNEKGVCGIVSQNAWMHLKSFKEIRAKFTSMYKIRNIANLGSGAFADLSGEKSNVSLLVFARSKTGVNAIRVLNLENDSLTEKMDLLKKKPYIELAQEEIDGDNGYEFYEESISLKMSLKGKPYKNYAVPMQGTSTGNSKEFVGFFWQHFNDKDWIKVSKGGGYCRWEGLNDCVVKWGQDGEYIKNQKGSALRNVKYFKDTRLVFSDTGTAGLNVRILLPQQIFIASGPGIRVQKGNHLAHLAFLNSRLAAYVIRRISPKLTIAAGYIGQIPVTEEICASGILSNHAQICIDLKEKILSLRPNCFEYDNRRFDNLSGDLKTLAWGLFHEDITNELLKLQIEGKIDNEIMEMYEMGEKEKGQLKNSVGECAYHIKREADIDEQKLDRYLSGLIGADCMLKRTRTTKTELGCDGLIEYAAKDLQISPEFLVNTIQKAAYFMADTLKKYEDFVLHNIVLSCLAYDVDTGASVMSCKAETIVRVLNHRLKSNIDYEVWLKNSFNSIHGEIFKGKPYIEYREKEKAVCVK